MVEPLEVLRQLRLGDLRILPQFLQQLCNGQQASQRDLLVFDDGGGRGVAVIVVRTVIGNGGRFGILRDFRLLRRQGGCKGTG